MSAASGARPRPPRAACTPTSSRSTTSRLHEGEPFSPWSSCPERACARRLTSAGHGRSRTPSRIMLQVLDALDCTHALGMVHQDMKPANIMLTPDTLVKVADFGVSRIANTRGDAPRSSTAGTPGYMSPEQCRGDRGRRPLRPVLRRNHALRDGGGTARLLRPQRHRGQSPHPEREAAPAAGRRARGRAAAAAGARAGDRKASGGSVRQCRRHARGSQAGAGDLGDDATRVRPTERAAGMAPPPAPPRDESQSQTVRTAARCGSAAVGRREAQGLHRPDRHGAGARGCQSQPLPRAARLRSRAFRPRPRRTGTLPSGSVQSVARPRGDRGGGGIDGRPRSPSAAACPSSELERAQAALTEYVGPIARVLVRQAAAQVSTVDALWQRLTKHVDAPEEQASFLRRRQSIAAAKLALRRHYGLNSFGRENPLSSSFLSSTGMAAAVLPFWQPSSATAASASNWRPGRVLHVLAIERGELGAVRLSSARAAGTTGVASASAKAAARIRWPPSPDILLDASS